MSIDSIVKSMFMAAKKITRNAALQYSLAFSLLAGSVGCADRSAIGTVPPDAGIDMAALLCVDEDQDGIYSTPKCGTEIDCNDTDASVWQTLHAYTDFDNDGFGAGKINEVCARLALPTGFALNNQDCDDYNSAIRPGMQELCDGIDNDCDVLSVDGFSEGAPLNSRQAGVCLGSQQQCIGGSWQDFYEQVRSYETPEKSCEGLDNNCDEQVDENLMLTFYIDRDSDGFGIIDEILPACTQPEGYTATLGDCNDDNNSINPSIEDICDSINNDCDEEVDEDVSVCEKVVFVSYRDGIRELYTVNSDGTNLNRLTEEVDNKYQPLWAPDGRTIFAITSSLIEALKPDGSDRRIVAENGPQPRFGYALSPDGSRIAFPSTSSSYNELYVVNTDGSELEQLIFNNHTLDPVWSPDGTKIAFLMYGILVGEVLVIDRNGSNLRSLINPGMEYCGVPSWSPDSFHVVYSCEVEADDYQKALYVAAVDGTTITRITSGSDFLNPQWSPDGATLAYFSERNYGEDVYIGEAYVINPNGTGGQNLTNGQRYVENYSLALKWSPDSSWIAFVASELEGGNAQNLYITRPNGSEVRRLTNHPEDTIDCRELKWSRDSNRIVYSCRPFPGGEEIYIVNIDGTGELHLSNHPDRDLEFDLNF